VEIRLKHFNLHVVHVILRELQHAMPQRIRLLHLRLHIALLSGLVLQPNLLEVLAHILTLQEVSEDQLVLVYRALRNDQCEWPFNLVVECECFVNLHVAGGLPEVHHWVLAHFELVDVGLPA